MSISQLVVDAVPSGAASLPSWLDELDEVVAASSSVDVAAATDAQLLDLVLRLGSTAARLSALKLAAIAQIDTRKAARNRLGATSTAAWLRSTGTAPGAATREVTLARALDWHAPTRDALAAGAISTEQAQVITAAVDALSDAVPDAERRDAEERLLAAAAWSDPVQLRKLATAQAARVDPAGAGDLERREQAMLAAREFTVSRDRDGMHRLAGRLDPLGAAQLLAVLDPLAAPRPAGDGRPDPRTPARRRADALVDLARLAAGGDQPTDAALRPTILVSIDHRVLTGQLAGAGLLAAGPLAEPISPAAARRLACDAGVLPAVLDGPSARLDLGRTLRTATVAQRLALVRRDGPTCAFPGCDRPYGWTKAHHVRHWVDGGASDVANLVLVCGAHHDAVHHHGWALAMRGGRPVFTPPASEHEPPHEPLPDG
jgi:hypothetical protein